MPIRPENKARYPKDWSDISNRIRFQRAKRRCECVGECGEDHGRAGGRCKAVHNKPHPATGSMVCLTVAHLPGHEVEDCRDYALKAMCQKCHNRMDQPMRRAGIIARTREKCAVGDLFPERKDDGPA